MKDIVSVIIAVYNAQKYLEECITSILNQTYRDIEIIIVNDGSVDKTEYICKRFVEQYSNIKYIQQENLGVSIARNRGIEHALGKYIVFVDGDDVLPDNSIERFLSFSDEDTDIVCSCCKVIGVKKPYIDHFFDGSYDIRTMEEKEKLFLQLLNGNYGKSTGRSSTAIGVPWAKLYRTDLIKRNNLQFDPDLLRMQDNEFNTRAFYYARRIKYIDEPLYWYRIDHIKDGKSPKEVEMRMMLLQKRRVFLEKHPEILSDNIKNEMYYEACVALAVYVEKIMRMSGFSNKKNQMIQLKNNSVITGVLQCRKPYVVPFKFRVLIILYKNNMYFLIYIMFLVYNYLFQKIDRWRKF